MDDDKLKGMGKQAAGKAREYAGKVTGDEDTEMEGRGDQMEGKVQEEAGDLKDKARDFGKKLKGD